jgi:hypothetical protein
MSAISVNNRAARNILRQSETSASSADSGSFSFAHLTPKDWIASAQELLAMTGKGLRRTLPVIANEAKQSSSHENGARFCRSGRLEPRAKLALDNPAISSSIYRNRLGKRHNAGPIENVACSNDGRRQ